MKFDIFQIYPDKSTPRQRSSGVQRLGGLLLLCFALLYSTCGAFRSSAHTASVPQSAAHSTGGPLELTNFSNLYSASGILVRRNDFTVLAQKDANGQVYPASLTKILTLLTALNTNPRLQDTVTFIPSDFAGLREKGAAVAGFTEGETVSIEDLLYGVMLPSGADAANALARAIAGSTENFVSMMNQTAADIGMSHSHFATVTGLHHPDHYTTVSDLALLLNKALDNPTFREVFTAKSYRTSSTWQHLGGLRLTSRFFEKMKAKEIEGYSILGGKTGYTDEAGLCLASLTEKDGDEYILITTGAPGNSQTEQYNILDAYTAYSSLQEPMS